MEGLLYRRAWEKLEGETQENFIMRLNLQFQQLSDLRRVRGQCYMIYIGEGDVRPMWENEISTRLVKEESHTPIRTKWDCPLCQPYDNWEGLASIQQNRRYMTRVIDPKYNNGTIDEGSVLQKCPCVLNPKARTRLKFKE